MHEAYLQLDSLEVNTDSQTGCMCNVAAFKTVILENKQYHQWNRQTNKIGCLDVTCSSKCLQLGFFLTFVMLSAENIVHKF